MSIRLATASGLALAAALMVATAVRAQSFFEVYDLSPRQIAGILADEGYELNGPMLRRGDVYVCNAVSISGRPVRLIVDAHRGRVLERFAISERRVFGDPSYDRRASRDDEYGSDDEQPLRRQGDLALGDPDSPRSHGDEGDGLSWQRPTPPDAIPDATPKAKRHAAKKHRDPAVANAPGSSATPSSEPSPAAEAPKPAPSPSVAAIAPSAPTPPPRPSVVRVIKLPSAQPEAAKPAVEAARPAPAPEVVKPTPEPSKAAQTHPTVEAEKAAPAEKPKPETPKKKINDLPVGTLD